MTSSNDVAPVETPVPLPAATRINILAYCGAMLVLMNLAAPSAGLIGIPVSFFLKNKLHLSALELAQFNLWVGIPLYLAFVFGFARDRWSPFGAGDRGHLMVFGAITAVSYAVIAFAPPTYSLLLGGLLIVTVSVQFVASAANALVSAAGQRHLMAGQASTIFNVANTLPALAAFLGGMLSDSLEAQSAGTAAKILFLLGAVLMAAIAVTAALGPRWLFSETTPHGAERESIFAEIGRLLRHRAIYPPLLMLALWDFGPALGTPMQYHMANELHATDSQVGLFYALYFSCYVPTLLIYGWLCQRMKLSRLLFIGTIFAIFQMIPLLFVQSANGAIIAGVVMGLLGGIASGAYVDLAIRSCPPGLQGTMMMLVVTVYWVAVRFGDIWGTDLYEHGGGFTTAVWASTACYVLILPVLLLAPRSLTATSDGEASS